MNVWENFSFNLLLIDFNNILWIDSKMLYVVTYFKVSTFIHAFPGDDMHCKVLCITESDIILVPKNLGFSENQTTVKTEL